MSPDWTAQIALRAPSINTDFLIIFELGMPPGFLFYFCSLRARATCESNLKDKESDFQIEKLPAYFTLNKASKKPGATREVISRLMGVTATIFSTRTV